MELNELDIFGVILASGPVVKLVLILLLFASIFSWAIIFKKRILINKANNNNKLFMDLYFSSISFDDLQSKIDKLSFSPYKKMFIIAEYK